MNPDGTVATRGESREPPDFDEHLCRLAAKGDHGAFQRLVERHRERTYRLAWSILRDPDDARDLSQDAFVRLFESVASFDARSRFSTWFFRIVVNLCLDHRRKNRWWKTMFSRQQASGEEDFDELPNAASDAPGPDQDASDNEQKRKLWNALSRLSEKQRAALTLQVQEGLSAREIGAILNCSEPTARVHLHRAMTGLKKLMAN